MMIRVLKKYSGVLFFYLAIVGMILLVNARFSYLNDHYNQVTYTIND